MIVEGLKSVQQVAIGSVCPEKLYLTPISLIDDPFLWGRPHCTLESASVIEPVILKGSNLFTGFSFTKCD